MFNFYETIKRLISGPGKSQDALKKESDTKPPLILISNQMRLNVKEGLEPYEIEEFKKIIEEESEKIINHEIILIERICPEIVILYC